MAKIQITISGQKARELEDFLDEFDNCEKFENLSYSLFKALERGNDEHESDGIKVERIED